MVEQYFLFFLILSYFTWKYNRNCKGVKFYDQFLWIYLLAKKFICNTDGKISHIGQNYIYQINVVKVRYSVNKVKWICAYK